MEDGFGSVGLKERKKLVQTACSKVYKAKLLILDSADFPLGTIEMVTVKNKSKD